MRWRKTQRGLTSSDRELLPKSCVALSAARRSWLREAAADANAWSAEHASDEVTAQVMTACDGGAKVATVGADGLTAFRRAARPAYEALQSNPVTCDRLARIQSLVDRVSPSSQPVPDIPPSCRYQPASAAESPPGLVQLQGPGDPGELPLGTYRFTRSEEQLVAAGMPPHDAALNAGVWTWTLGPGTWHFELQPSNGTVPGAYTGNTCDGWLDVTGDLISLTTVTVYPTSECAPKVFSLRWRRQGADLVIGEMTERGNAHGAPDPLWSGFPWRRIA